MRKSFTTHPDNFLATFGTRVGTRKFITLVAIGLIVLLYVTNFIQSNIASSTSETFHAPIAVHCCEKLLAEIYNLRLELQCVLYLPKPSRTFSTICSIWRIRTFTIHRCLTTSIKVHLPIWTVNLKLGRTCIETR